MRSCSKSGFGAGRFNSLVYYGNVTDYIVGGVSASLNGTYLLVAAVIALGPYVTVRLTLFVITSLSLTGGGLGTGCVCHIVSERCADECAASVTHFRTDTSCIYYLMAERLTYGVTTSLCLTGRGLGTGCTCHIVSKRITCGGRLAAFYKVTVLIN
jgi:hypothetical protein